VTGRELVFSTFVVRDWVHVSLKEGRKEEEEDEGEEIDVGIETASIRRTQNEKAHVQLRFCS